MSMQPWWKGSDKGKTGRPGEGNLSQCQMVHKSPTRTGLGSNPGFHCVRGMVQLREARCHHHRDRLHGVTYQKIAVLVTDIKRSELFKHVFDKNRKPPD